MFFCHYTIVRQIQILCSCLNTLTYPNMEKLEWFKSFLRYPIFQ